MDKKTEALTLALERLDTALQFDEDREDGYYESAIIAVREALAEQPAQQCKYGNEPVSCTSSPMDCQCALDAVFEQPAQQQEPVAWLVTSELQDGTRKTYPLMGRYKYVKDACDFGSPVPLYTSPPARKPLTDERIAEIAAQGHQRWIDFARCVEAEHGIKEN